MLTSCKNYNNNNSVVSFSGSQTFPLDIFPPVIFLLGQFPLRTFPPPISAGIGPCFRFISVNWLRTWQTLGVLLFESAALCQWWVQEVTMMMMMRLWDARYRAIQSVVGRKVSYRVRCEMQPSKQDSMKWKREHKSLFLIGVQNQQCIKYVD